MAERRLAVLSSSGFGPLGGLWCAQEVTQRLFGAPTKRDFTGREPEEYKRYVDQAAQTHAGLRIEGAPSASVASPTR